MKKILRDSALVLTLSAIGLSACNQPETPVSEGQLSAPQTSSGGPLPVPTVTPTSKPTPFPTPTTTPSPIPTPTSDPTDFYTGPEGVAPYVGKFISDGALQGVDVIPDMSGPKLTIRIASLNSYGSSVIGLCETGGGLRRVTYDPDFWNSVSDTQRELLSHHELGHCVLYRGHDTTLRSGGSYDSIMYPIIMGSSTYLNGYDHYQQELFSLSAQAPVSATAIKTHICNLEDM